MALTAGSMELRPSCVQQIDQGAYRRHSWCARIVLLPPAMSVAVSNHVCLVKLALVTSGICWLHR